MEDTLHANNLTDDRALGTFWEEQFCLLAAQHGRAFTALQIGKQGAAISKDAKLNPYTLPDVAIWTAPGEHHEIKHKNPYPDRRHGPSYGLEVYRFNALLWFAQETGQSVMYTIHDHDKAGGRELTINKIEHWLTVNVLALNNQWYTCRPTKSYVNGKSKTVDCYYWHANLWRPLFDYWYKKITPWTSLVEIKQHYPSANIETIPASNAKANDLWCYTAPDNGRQFIARIIGTNGHLIQVGKTNWVELYPKIGTAEILRLT